MILLYLLCIISLLWLGQWINHQLLSRGLEWLAYIWLILVLVMQGVLIYYFVEAILKWLVFILKLFYK
ncbi:hypothetical protein [Staphylococcus hyicus]|uniref:hypothetical protein n=1 Tax=Staphylococcus hyicus TaxID=1284 RepID=UPI00208FD4CF|nr:hypothetical protein [Staphylococcus hyicus]MCO4328569.1 hypothetical protein [Staphylococcus hyicus]MCO4332233.1 hypothetical protein [Staphylococcus hyicus]MCO4334759.1 hypothetical protein [Staphylococcus hyicus]MCO4335489.1 hypothetical protein [Staphylococcus hyicus]